MLDKITTASNAEQIRDAVARVLTTELSQYDIATENIFIERYDPFTTNELPAINVCLVESIPTDSSTPFTTTHDSKIIVEVYTSIPSDDETRADEAGSREVMRLAMLLHKILMHPDLRYLDFVQKFISNRNVLRIVRTEPRTVDDANTCVMATVEIEYKHEEINEVGAGVPLMEYTTQALIDNTNIGFKYGNI